MTAFENSAHLILSKYSETDPLSDEALKRAIRERDFYMDLGGHKVGEFIGLLGVQGFLARSKDGCTLTPAGLVEVERLAKKISKDEIPPGRYLHFKGREYDVVGTAIHAETDERLVVYRPRYAPRMMFVRPHANFVEEVQRGAYKGPRFRLLPPSPVGEMP